jgi:ADP-ribosylglycohydrolase
LEESILDQDEPRWRRLQLGLAGGIDVRDRSRGALVGGAIGDAMGRANEGLWPSEARARGIREYQPRHGCKSGPKGTITDDTQMTLWLAESILEAALWAFHGSDPLEDGALLAVNLGDDADTTGAVYGQLAGAYYGEQGISEKWRSRPAYRELIERDAEQLCALGHPA